MSASTSSPALNERPRAGFFRRLGAWVYDLLIVVAILLLATLIALFLQAGLVATGLLTLPEGTEPSEFLRTNLIFQAYLFSCLFGFFIWFWRRGGQTAGMKTWRLKLQSLDGQRLTHRQCIVRLLTCFFGLGNILLLVPGLKKRSLQDICSNTEIIVLSKEENKHINWKGYL
ncbi:RDD family protein [Catenovulum sp. 2E275]|uniref:RDD family protein n=1 Tax=Catenovulum sp. 2E275 TaxID=2980497 RepID=UPI0021CF731D|nr:RDD family protein [Catenovulum sp. 2E275]MCU4676105.1 RDD family protein [Catenovulum sp. 2E275]